MSTTIDSTSNKMITDIVNGISVIRSNQGLGSFIETTVKIGTMCGVVALCFTRSSTWHDRRG